MSVITYLERRAREAVLSSDEQASVTTSINTIKTRLSAHFGADVSEQLRFGSSTRGTILPRSMDARSDIDYMVVFRDGGYIPQTYLDRLKRFAEKYYRSSDIKQSSPSIILELDHINFDLVPALKQQWGGAGYRIPNGPNAWQDTDPNDFNAKLTAKNNAEQSMIKPTIRLAKSWNAQSGYVYDAYSFEQYIVGLWYGLSSNQRDYLFNVIDSLSISYSDAQWRREKIARAKTIVNAVRQLERDGYQALAEAEIKKLIPD